MVAYRSNSMIFIIFLASNFLISTTSTSGLDCYRAVHEDPIYCSGRSISTFVYPFWEVNDQNTNYQYYCGYPGLRITCSTNGKPIINISNHSYYLKEAFSDVREREESRRITIVDPNFVERICPRPSPYNFSVVGTVTDNFKLTFFLDCTSPPPPLRILPSTRRGNRSHHIDCLDYNNNNNNNNNNRTLRSYGFFDFEVDSKGDQMLLADWNVNYCKESVVVPVKDVDEVSEYMQTLQSGFVVKLSTPIECKMCERSGGFCSYNKTANGYFSCWCEAEGQRGIGTNGREYCFHYAASSRSKILIGVLTGVGGLMLLILLLVYCKNQRKKRGTISKNVDLFLESYGCRSLQRYKYENIKKMTNSFKDKLGQGGYGSVFKGKLTDGRLVAVKVLINDPEKSTNGEDFINEVATIGRTNHVNVVVLLGFCSSGSKRALVYEFMHNGSLEKFIYTKQKKNTATPKCTSDIPTTTSTITTFATEVDPLGWEKLYQIALGIARGLEYLHRDCNTGRILHFDIKPHNILLDENFCPKISDFGLAKLCPMRESIVSMLSGGRGTIGYIAPEVYNRNFGGVSYKSDVYSYGMMVLEMVGGRKNTDPFLENTSELYFPHWVYNRMEKQNGKIEDLLRFEEAFEEEMARKMILVGLWCIQTHQANRPSMGRVAEMLEGSLKDLQMPPNPFVDPSLHPPPTA